MPTAPAQPDDDALTAAHLAARLAALPPAQLPAWPAAGEARVVAAYVQTLLATATEAGLALPALAQAAGLPAEALAPGVESLSVADYLALLHQAARLSGDPLFGLRVGEHARLSTYPFHGLVVCACPSLRAAVEQTGRFEGLVHDLGRSRLSEADGLATYHWDCPWLPALPPDLARHLCDSVMGGILTFASWLAHARLPVRALGLPVPPPAPALQAAQRQLFGAELHYDQPHAWGRFDAALLDRPVPNADTSMAPLLQQHAQARLAERLRASAEPPLLTQVRRLIAEGLAEDRARLDAVATALALPPRTLQRKLADAGTSFQALLDAERQALATRLLPDARLTLTEVAYLLGYREQSSFNRACRDWYGLTPAQRRSQLQAGGPA